MSISIKTTYPRVDVTYFWPQGRIKQEVGEFEIAYQGPKIEIQQQAAFNEIGMGDLNNLQREVVYSGKQAVLAGIARRAQEGDRYANDLGQRNTTVEIVKAQLFAEIPEVNVAARPSNRPEIDFSYSMDMNWNNGGAMIQFQILSPKINWNLGEVVVSSQKGSKLDLKG